MRLAVAAMVLLGARAAAAGTVTITDCVLDPHLVVSVGTGATRIEVGADDLVVACPLEPVGGTGRLILDAHDVTIQGPAGALLATGPGRAIDVTARGRFSATQASIEASDANGEIGIASTGDVLLDRATVTVGGATAGGDAFAAACSAPGCTVTLRDASIKARVVQLRAVGDVVFEPASILTNSPRDLIAIVSDTGAARLGGCGTALSTGVEGNLTVTAAGAIDLTSANVLVAENVTLTSGAGVGAAPVAATVDLTGASVRNDFGKRGDIRVSADEGRAAILIDGAILIDDDADVSELNGRESAPHTGLANVTGAPETDG